MLESIVNVHVDEKLVCQDRFDDLTTLEESGRRERIQIKHTDNDERALTLATFTSDARSLRLDYLISSALADRDGPGSEATEASFRILLRDTVPTDEQLLAFLKPACPDPGPFVSGMHSRRMTFHSDALWEHSRSSGAGQPDDNSPFDFLRTRTGEIKRSDLDWVCERLIVELDAPAASLDLTRPGEAEQLLLTRVREDVGSGAYPNANRSHIDVAEALIGCARAARHDSLKVSAEELQRRTQLRIDFGAVARRNPVNKEIEVPRSLTVAEIVQQAANAADSGKIMLLVGPPGQGKSWICEQVVGRLEDQDWIVAEHYCYLEESDPELRPRALVESVIGSLMKRIGEIYPDILSLQRPRFVANEEALERAIKAALAKENGRRLALVVDGIDHVSRVIGTDQGVDPSLALAQVLASIQFPKGSTLIVLSQPGTHIRPIERSSAVSIPVPRLTDDELRQLAIRLKVISESADGSCTSGSALLRASEVEAEGYIAALSDRSSGNALYATYLCRESLRNPTTMADPTASVRHLPQYDGSLQTYYRFLYDSLEAEAAWVADVIALVDFPLSRNDLKQIRPDSARYVDQAVECLRPVLSELAAQAGIRVYHESFARFLREPFQDNPDDRIALLDRIIQWLGSNGIFDNTRSFRFLLRTLF